MIHHVFANRSNIGDWLSARGIQELVGRPVVEHLCDGPFVEETLQRLSELTPADVLIVGGGGLFMDYFEPWWRGLLDLDLQARLCIWGVGYCDLKDEPTRPPRGLIQGVADRADLLVVRDTLTRDHLGRDAWVVPCPSLTMVDPRPVGRGLLHVDNYTTVGAAAYERMSEIGAEFATATTRPYRTTNNRIEAGREPELLELLERYAISDVVLSSALHGCIIALGMGRPVVAVSGDWKIEALMHAAGLGDWVVDSSETDQVAQLLARAGEQARPSAWLHNVRTANRAVSEAVRQLSTFR